MKRHQPRQIEELKSKEKYSPALSGIFILLHLMGKRDTYQNTPQSKIAMSHGVVQS